MSGRILTALVATAFACLICEGLTRVWVPDPTFRFENQIEMFAEDSLLGYRNAPHFHGYAQGFVRLQTNSLGFRGEEISRQKPPHRYRILGLGDSVTWGVGVQEEQTFLRVLERELNAPGTGPGTRRFENLNAAVIGYSLYQERLSLERDGVTLAPNLVIVGFVLNDFYPTEDPFNNLRAFHRPSRTGVRRLAYAPAPPVHSYLYRLARTGLRIARRRLSRNWDRKDQVDERRLEWPPPGVGPDAWPVMEEHFRAMKRLADANGFRLLVVVFPSALQYAPIDTRPQAQIDASLTAAGIDYLDLFDAFRPHVAEVFLDTLHLTEEGHRLTAAELLRFLTARQWLPSDRDGRAARSADAAAL